MLPLKTNLASILSAIRNQKLLFIILFLTQLLVIIFFSYIAITYQLKILNDAQTIATSIQNANFNSEELQAGNAFLNSPASLLQTYNSLKQNILHMTLWFMALFIVGQGFIWYLSQRLLHQKPFTKAEMRNFILRFFISTTTVALIFLGLSYFLISQAFTIESNENSISSLTSTILSIAFFLYLLLLLFYAFLRNPTHKQLIQEYKTAITRRVHYTVLTLITNLLLIALSLYLIYLSVTYQSSLLLFISPFVFVSILVLTRLFWINSLNSKSPPHEI